MADVQDRLHSVPKGELHVHPMGHGNEAASWQTPDTGLQLLCF